MNWPEFSITFMIQAKSNSAWNSKETDLKFPPFTVENGIRVFVIKQLDFIKVFIHHPRYGYRKLTSSIIDFIGNDTFVVITNSKNEAKLYLNAKLVNSISQEEMSNNIEIGDVVLVKIKNNDLKNIKINVNVEMFLPAEIKGVSEKNVHLFFFDINEFAKLSRDRIVV